MNDLLLFTQKILSIRTPLYIHKFSHPRLTLRKPATFPVIRSIRSKPQVIIATEEDRSRERIEIKVAKGTGKLFIGVFPWTMLEACEL